MNVLKKNNFYFVENGLKERKRIQNKLLETLNYKEKTIPTLTVVNVTPQKRLANIAIGRMRRRFLISYGKSIRLKKQFPNSIVTRNNTYNYRQKQVEDFNRINKSYYLLDYREVSDFTLYLGEDFFLIKKKKNKKK